MLACGFDAGGLAAGGFLASGVLLRCVLPCCVLPRGLLAVSVRLLGLPLRLLPGTVKFGRFAGLLLGGFGNIWL